VLSAASAVFASLPRPSSLAPLLKRVVVPARQAYSHSASVGSRYVRCSFLLSHWQNSMASCQLTMVTASSLDGFQPGLPQLYWPPATASLIRRVFGLNTSKPLPCCSTSV